MQQVTAVLIGAGLRGGEVYSAYALEHPNEFNVVAVAEPDEVRRERFAKQHNIPTALTFRTWEELLGREKLADCAMVCTQDRMHYEPVQLALERGYHVLCEKPMSPDKTEIYEMGRAAEKYDRILSICHVLRYSPFFVKIRDLLQEGRIGDLINVQHIEEVGYWHHAHSFVRGNWRREDETSPMILQKCCHDMDILLWLIESDCIKINSFGSLSYFRKENCPKGAPAMCLDGCQYGDACAFYAPKFYLEHPRAQEDNFVQAVTSDLRKEAVLEALHTGPYGRCVFACDNTVVDHQVVNLEFANGVTVSFTMCAFTERCTRKVNLMGTKGQLTGDMEAGMITVRDFVTGYTDTIRLNTPTKGHSGSDSAMMKDFVRQVALNRTDNLRSSASVSVDSHLMTLAAEESRHSGQTVDFQEYKKELAAACAQKEKM